MNGPDMNLTCAARIGAKYLEKKGVSSPSNDAEELLSHVLSIQRLRIYTEYTRELGREEVKRYANALKRRARGEPLQYITGSVEFRGISLVVEPGVFIPRPETEITVEYACEVIPDRQVRILDIGTGCGNIALSIAAERPSARIYAIDISEKAISLCMKNAETFGVSSRIEVLHGDLYQALNGTNFDFDCIVSNPPYVRDDEWEDLEREVRQFEPAIALKGGKDGLDLIRKIIIGAPRFLKQGGWLVLEIAPGQAEYLLDYIKNLKSCESANLSVAWSDIRCFNDLCGRPRVLRARLSGKF